MSKAAQVEAVTAAAHALDPEIRGLSDTELLAQAAAIEEAGRVLDARRAASRRR